MSSRIVSNEWEREQAISLVRARKFPFTLTITKKRTLHQNAGQHVWHLEVARQLGDRTAEEVRGEMKLTLGVPILRAENDKFREAYDKHIRHLPYETKLAMMMEPLDWPVTRLMTTKQFAQYLDAVQRHWAAQGIVLELKRAA